MHVTRAVYDARVALGWCKVCNKQVAIRTGPLADATLIAFARTDQPPPRACDWYPIGHVNDKTGAACTGTKYAL